jgi:hypothetical protein
MRTTLIALVVVLLGSTALTADRNNLPVHFAGDWCLVHSGNDKEPSTNRRVPADGFIAHETRCSVVEAVADERSNILVKFQCSGEGQTWTRNYWMSLRLRMEEAEREP